ncbi:MAG: hypothetical protein WD335_03140 [Candidatus Paceibacterota bacterium]
MKKHKTKIIWTVVIVGLVGLMFWGSQSSNASNWEDTDISCIPGGHQSLAFHIHADLKVLVDGQQQIIPANTGISHSCMAEVHTHNTSGQIHIESTNRSTVLTLADFFAVWGEDTERDGYETTVLVNGEEAGFLYEWRDGDSIEVVFTAEEGTDNETDDTATTSTDQTATTSDDDATSTETESTAEVEVEGGATTSIEEE